MKRWVLAKRSDDHVVSLIVEQEDRPAVFTDDPSEWIDITENPNIDNGWRYNKEENKFYPIPVVKDTVLTRMKMIEELGDAYVETVIKAKTDAAVEVWLEKFRMQESFRLNDQSVIDQINFLVTKSIISQEEADRILGL